MTTRLTVSQIISREMDVSEVRFHERAVPKKEWIAGVILSRTYGSAQIGLVLLDLHRPKMDGLEVLKIGASMSKHLLATHECAVSQAYDDTRCYQTARLKKRPSPPGDTGVPVSFDSRAESR